MSADVCVIICVSNKTCDQIEIVTRNGTGVGGGLRTGAPPAAATADAADEANLLAGQAAGGLRSRNPWPVEDHVA